VKWLVVVCGIAGAARVDADSEDDAARATKLFEEGRKLETRGDVAGACERFEQSYALDAAPGTAMNLAKCEENAENWHRAWTLYDTAADIFVRKGDGRRAKFARDRADQILTAHPTAADAPRVEAPVEKPRIETRPESRLGLKLLAGGSFVVAAAGGVWWLTSYLTISDFRGTNPIGEPLSVPDDCGTLFVDPTDPNTARFDDACAASDRLTWLVPVTLVSAAIGTGVLVYLWKTEPKRVVVTPSVSGSSAALTASFEW
jgi:hypothetical protein